MNFYRRKSTSGQKPTEVPGMSSARKESGSNASVPESISASSKKKPAVPVVGFLYSISHNGCGEFWPVYVGTNTIGRSEKNDICLHEMTVSENHAVLMSKVMRRDGKVIASIKDAGSKTGILVNDTEELGYESFELKDGDRILIGNAYELLFILIDPAARGLKAAESFVEDDSDSTDDIGGGEDIFGEDTWDESGSATNNFYDSSRRNTNGTVNLDSDANFDTGKTTVI